MDLSVDEAANRLGVSRVRIRQLLASGDLLGRRLGRVWLVDRDSVMRLEGQRRDPGRPVGPKRACVVSSRESLSLGLTDRRTLAAHVLDGHELSDRELHHSRGRHRRDHASAVSGSTVPLRAS